MPSTRIPMGSLRSLTGRSQLMVRVIRCENYKISLRVAWLQTHIATLHAPSPAPLSHCCISTGLAKGDILRPPYYLLRRPENRTSAPNEVAVGFDASQN